MPGVSGLQLAEGVLGLHPEAKVLLVSGYSESLGSGAPLGGNIHFLQKPFTPEHLTRTVQEAIAED
jgi:two-component system cell cycle sensor histidine kinase/response regulator CckA